MISISGNYGRDNPRVIDATVGEDVIEITKHFGGQVFLLDIYHDFT